MCVSVWVRVWVWVCLCVCVCISQLSVFACRWIKLCVCSYAFFVSSWCLSINLSLHIRENHALLCHRWRLPYLIITPTLQSISGWTHYATKRSCGWPAVVTLYQFSRWLSVKLIVACVWSRIFIPCLPICYSIPRYYAHLVSGRGVYEELLLS